VCEIDDLYCFSAVEIKVFTLFTPGKSGLEPEFTYGTAGVAITRLWACILLLLFLSSLSLSNTFQPHTLINRPRRPCCARMSFRRHRIKY
jgi:hypothetical protein